MNDRQEQDIFNSDESNILCCIGVDGKRHRCIAWEDTCLCGVKILHKNPSQQLETKYIYSCYECTY